MPEAGFRSHGNRKNRYSQKVSQLQANTGQEENDRSQLEQEDYFINRLEIVPGEN